MLNLELPKVSIIIVNYNRKNDTEECIQSILNSEYPKERLEVIIIDNGSSDGSVEFLKQKYSQYHIIRIVSLDKNYGFCLPNNMGARMANGDYIFFLNNDTIIEKSCILKLAEAAIKYEKNDVVAFAPKILYYDAPRIIQVAGGTLSIIGFGYYRGDGEKDSHLFSKVEYVGFASGAAAFINRDFFLSVQGFDPEYFASAEETELGFKIWLSGKKVLYVPSARVYHKVSVTFGRRGPTPWKVHLQTRNRLLNMFKFVNSFDLIFGFLLSIGLDLKRFIQYLLLRDLDCAYNILLAYINAIKIINKKYFKRKRSALQSLKKVDINCLKKKEVFATITECLKREIYLTYILGRVFFRKRWDAS
ncbi:MAG: glycosyltransferase family 2 protein [Nitrososphaerota archaeon]